MYGEYEFDGENNKVSPNCIAYRIQDNVDIVEFVSRIHRVSKYNQVA